MSIRDIEMTNLIDSSAKGVYPISITPFDARGAVDFEGVDRLTDFFLACGVPGVTLLGVLGEASKLSNQESLAIVERVIRRVRGRLQVIVGASHLGFDNFKAFTDAAMEAGAAGIMVAPATGLKTEEQVLAFFDTLIGYIGAQVPLALQDFPQNTGVFMSVDTIGRLAQRHPSIKIVKHEEGSALRKITRLRAAGEEGVVGSHAIAEAAV